MFTSHRIVQQKLVFVALLALFLLFGSAAATLAAPAEGVDMSVTAVSASSNGYYYTVKWGDYLSRIALQNSTTVHAILSANPQITNPNFIYAGQVIFIPTGPAAPPPAPPPVVTCRYYHYVNFGQTLSGIAAWYGVSPWAIAQANGLYNLNHIYAGQYLCIP